MGTRTYSRRAADGSRKPTALGIRTGRFVGETRPDLGEDGDKLLTKWNRRMRDLVSSTQDIFMEPMQMFSDEMGNPTWDDRLPYVNIGDTGVEMSARVPEEFQRLYTDIQDSLGTALSDILTSIINTQGVDVIEETEAGKQIGDMFDLVPTSRDFRIDDFEDFFIGAAHLINTRENGRERANNALIVERTSNAIRKVELAIDTFEELVANPLIQNNPALAAVVDTVLKESKRAFNNVVRAEKNAIQPIRDDVYSQVYSYMRPQGGFTIGDAFGSVLPYPDAE